MEATFTKLRSGEWGVRVVGTARAGAVVTCRKKSGETSTETIGRVVWSGNGVSLCTIGASGARPSRSSGRTDCRRYGWDGVDGSSSYYSSGQYDEDS